MQNSNCLLLAYALLASERTLLSEEDYDNLRRRAILYAMVVQEPLLFYLLIGREIEDAKKYKSINQLLLVGASSLVSISDLNQLEQNIKQDYTLGLTQAKAKYMLLYDATVLQFAQTTQDELDKLKLRIELPLTKTEVTTLLATFQAMEDRSNFTLAQLQKLSAPNLSDRSTELSTLQLEIDTILNKNGVTDKALATMPNLNKIQRLISEKNDLLFKVAVKFKDNNL